MAALTQGKRGGRTNKTDERGRGGRTENVAVAEKSRDKGRKKMKSGVFALTERKREDKQTRRRRNKKVDG